MKSSSPWEKGFESYADCEGPDQTAHAQSDLDLRCPLIELLYPEKYNYVRKSLIRLWLTLAAVDLYRSQMLRRPLFSQ